MSGLIRLHFSLKFVAPLLKSYGVQVGLSCGSHVASGKPDLESQG
jgi:hypothetical protein